MSMIAARRRRSTDFWPGFVDALSSLLMVLVFLIMIFSIGQFVLSDAISGRDRALSQLNAELSKLAEQLSMTESDKAKAQTRLQEIMASFQTLQDENKQNLALLTTANTELNQNEEDLARTQADLLALQQLKKDLEAEIAARLADLETNNTKLVEQTELSAKSAAQVELLNRQLAALKEQLSELSTALDLEQAKVKAKDVEIDSLGKKLNLALANKVNELNKYRSDFFGKMKEILGNRSDIVVVGDRFVVPSALLFDSGSATLSPAAQNQLSKLASTLKEIEQQIPSDVPWVLRIDGHTDKRPINTPEFASNWELSSARALSMVKYLIAQGVPAQRLAATGFGEHQPLDTADTDAAYAKNRRIEIQLTNP